MAGLRSSALVCWILIINCSWLDLDQFSLSLSISLSLSLSPSLRPSLPPSLSHSLSPSLPPSLPLSLPPSLTLSLSLYLSSQVALSAVAVISPRHLTRSVLPGLSSSSVLHLTCRLFSSAYSILLYNFRSSDGLVRIICLTST